MADIYEKIDHENDGLNLLISQFANRSRLIGWIKSALIQIQQIEDDTFDIGEGFLIDFAIGQQLDYLGNIVLQSRNGLDDDAYRIFIKAKIASNKSSGTPDDLQMISALLDSSPDYWEQYPASVVITLNDSITSLAVRSSINTILQVSKPGGISLDVIDPTYAGTNHFKVTESISTGNGALGSLYGTISNAGKLVSIITPPIV